MAQCKARFAENGHFRLRNPAAPEIPGVAILGEPARRAEGSLDLRQLPPRPCQGLQRGSGPFVWLP